MWDRGYVTFVASSTSLVSSFHAPLASAKITHSWLFRPALLRSLFTLSSRRSFSLPLLCLPPQISFHPVFLQELQSSPSLSTSSDLFSPCLPVGASVFPVFVYLLRSLFTLSSRRSFSLPLLCLPPQISFHPVFPQELQSSPSLSTSSDLFSPCLPAGASVFPVFVYLLRSLFGLSSRRSFSLPLLCLPPQISFWPVFP